METLPRIGIRESKCRLGLIMSLLLSSISAAEEPRVFVSNEYLTFGSSDYFTVAIELADIDLDDDLDAIMINGRHWARQDLLFSNNGTGRFLIAHPLGEAATGYTPAIVDLDADGNLDIVVARDRIRSMRFMGQGNGEFGTGLPIGLPGPTRAVVSADLDADGNKDLIFSQRGSTNYVAFGPDFDRIENFGDAEQSVRLDLGDFDGDHDVDVVFANLGPEGSGLHFNDGAGRFGDVLRLDPAHGPAVDVAAADINGDGLIDIAFAAIGANVIFLNDADHEFVNTIVFGADGERSYGIDLGDLDKDGDVDIAIANDGGPNAIYFNVDGKFERRLLPDDPTARSYGVSIGDLNGDGFPDLVFANSGSMSRVYLNTTAENAESILAR
jgi:hypothetical protein